MYSLIKILSEFKVANKEDGINLSVIVKKRLLQ